MGARFSLIWVAACLSGLLTGPVFAGPEAASKDPPQTAVLLVPEQGFSADAERLIHKAVLGRALAHSGPDGAWRLVAFSGLAPTRSPQARLAEVQARLERGKQQYRYLKLDEARMTLSGAFDFLAAEPMPACQAKPVAELLLYWARAVLDGGDSDGAQRILTRIPRFDADAGPDPAVMPPNLVATFDLALEERKLWPAAGLTLSSGPSAGAMWVDCRRLAAGQVEIRGRVGDALLLGAEVNGGEFGATLPLVEGPSRSLRVYSGHPGDEVLLARHLAGLKKTRPRLAALVERTDSDLDGLAGLLEVRILLLAEPVQAVGGRYVRLGLYGPGHGALGKPVDVPLDGQGRPDEAVLAAAMARLAAQGQSPTVLAVLGGASPRQVPPPSKAADAPLAVVADPPPAGDAAGDADGEPVAITPWYETWWFWTAAGVLVAGAVGAGVGLGLANEDGGPSGQVVLSIKQPR